MGMEFGAVSVENLCFFCALAPSLWKMSLFISLSFEFLSPVPLPFFLLLCYDGGIESAGSAWLPH